MICDGLDEISIYGIEFLQSNAKNNLILSWITFLSAVFNSENNSIDKILMKVPEYFSYLYNILEMGERE